MHISSSVDAIAIEGCNLSKHLSSIIAEYSGEDLLRAHTARSQKWVASRKAFRTSYVLSSESKICARAHPAIEAAMDSAQFMVSIQLENEESIRSIQMELKPLVNNLAFGDSGVAIFVTVDFEPTFPNKDIFDTLCDGITAKPCDYYVFTKNMYSFALHCESDVFVGASLDFEVTAYVAGLCSTRVILAPESNAKLQNFNNVLLFPLLQAPTPSYSKNVPESRLDARNVDTAEVSHDGIFQQRQRLDQNNMNKYNIDIISREIEFGRTRDIVFDKVFELASCRNDEILEHPTQGCQYRSTDISGIKSDFDAIRKATDLCEMEFALGNVDNTRLWMGYRTPEACVHAMVKAWQNIFLGRTRTPHEYSNIASYSIDMSKTYDYLAKKGYNQREFDVMGLVGELAETELRYESTCTNNWMWKLSHFEDSFRSQGGQDGVLKEILQHIGTTNKYFVELGFNSPSYTEGSNSYYLYENGWTGLILDKSYENLEINLHKEFITPENIVSLLEKYSVPHEPDYFSIDIDSQDLWVLRAMLNKASLYRPRVISLEYNANFPLAATVTLPPTNNITDSVGWDGFDNLYGASAGAIKLVANAAGYEVLHMLGLFDMFLVRRDLLDGACPPPFASFAKKNYRMVHFCVTQPTRQNLWVELKTYLRTGDLQLAQYAAKEQMLLLLNPGGDYVTSPECLGITFEKIN